MSLYPLKFSPIYKERIWGGSRFKTCLNRTDVPSEVEKCGESWELSAVEDNVSVVSNGNLAGNNIQELIEVYMDELVGMKVYEKFGIEFPLLFKFLDTTDKLSIQVHPNNEVAKKRHHAWGKSELWYVLDAKPKGELIVGFKKDVEKADYLRCLEEKNFPEILNFEPAKADDVFYIPSGRLHAIMEGFLIAEIQQTSDITYRIYDWDRVDDEGKGRELHTDLAVDVLDYNYPEEGYKSRYSVKEGYASIQKTPYFTINRIDLDGEILTKDMYGIDSFVVYMCLDGNVSICPDGLEPVLVAKGETVLVPASLPNYEIRSDSYSKLLEVYID